MLRERKGVQTTFQPQTSPSYIDPHSVPGIPSPYSLSTSGLWKATQARHTPPPVGPNQQHV